MVHTINESAMFRDQSLPEYRIALGDLGKINDLCANYI